MEISIEIGNQNHEKYAYVISKMIVFAAQKKKELLSL
jgi:hypothetical protein